MGASLRRERLVRARTAASAIEDVGTPGDRREIGGDWFDAREEQCFGGEQGEPSEPAVRGKGAEAAGAEISEEE